MKCSRRLQTLIQLYADGEASLEQRRAVDAHVATCPRCARELSEVRRCRAMVAALPGRTLGEDFDERVLATIRAGTVPTVPAAGWERFRFGMRRLRRAPGMAAVVVGVAAVLTMTVLWPAQAPRAYQTEIGELVTSAVDRHRELAPRVTDPRWDAIDISVDLSTGSVVSE